MADPKPGTSTNAILRVRAQHVINTLTRNVKRLERGVATAANVAQIERVYLALLNVKQRRHLVSMRIVAAIALVATSRSQVGCEARVIALIRQTDPEIVGRLDRKRLASAIDAWRAGGSEAKWKPVHAVVVDVFGADAMNLASLSRSYRKW